MVDSGCVGSIAHPPPHPRRMPGDSACVSS